MSAGGVNDRLTPDGLKWTASEDHSVVDVEAESGQHVRVVRSTRGGLVSLAVEHRKGGGMSTAVLSADAMRMLSTVIPEEPMTPMWTFEGEQLRDLLEDLGVTSEEARQSIYRLRFAVDEGTLKIKVNEYTWSPGKAADGQEPARPVDGPYRRGDTTPPVGTRVVHEEYGPGAIAATPTHLQQWWVEFDTPVPVDGQHSHTVNRVWTYPYLLRPEVQ